MTVSLPRIPVPTSRAARQPVRPIRTPNAMRHIVLLLLASLVWAGFIPRAGPAQDGAITRQQLQTLIPDQQDLQGFIRVWPAGEFINPDGSSRAGVIEDQVVLDGREDEYHPGWVTLPDKDGRMSQIKRSLYSEDGEFHLVMTVSLCDAPETAHLEVQEFLHACSTRFQQGTFGSASAIGDESWFNPSGYSTLIGRAGRVVFLIDGSRSSLASRRSNSPRFPEAAVEAVAYQVLLRASQQPALTGVPAQDTHRDAKGRALPKDALWVAGRVYIPTQEFARAMGLERGAQGVTRRQLQRLMPDESDLAGFARMQLSKFQPSQDVTGADSDYIDPNHDVTQWSPGRPSTPKRTGTVSRIRRSFASSDGNYVLSIAITLCDTPEAAEEEAADFRRAVQSGYRPGTLTGRPRIGDESWCASNNALLFRQGRMMVLVDGDETMAGGRRANVPPFPPSALEAAAYECLLRAAQQPELTGVSGLGTSVAVSGHVLPKNALLVGKKVYIPAQEFAEAMGLAGGRGALPQGLTREQLQSLIPDGNDLRGFVRVLPGSDTPSLLKNGDATVTPQVPAQPVKDAIFLRNDPTSTSYWSFVFSETVSVGAIKRLFQSADGTFDLDIEVILCDSPEAAHEQLSHLHWTAGMWVPGGLTGPEIIGDESLALVKNGRTKTVAFRYGSLLAVVEGDRSNRSFLFNRALTIQTMPPAAVEAAAYLILLRASRQAKLVGVPAQDARLMGDGHAPPKDALMVGDQVYFPAREFAKAIGLATGSR